jgi:hypothetical protein
MKLRYLMAAVLALSVAAVAQEFRRDGNWQVTAQMSMPDMPQMQMPAQTLTQCITKEQAADPQQAMPPSGRGGPSDCKVSDYKVEGNKVTFTATCPSQGATMNAEIVYGQDKYDGTMKMTMARGGQPMNAQMKYTGKRLGDCEKK